MEFDTPINTTKKVILENDFNSRRVVLNNESDLFCENKSRQEPPTSQQSTNANEKGSQNYDQFYYISSTHSRGNPDLLTAFGSLKGNTYFRKTLSTLENKENAQDPVKPAVKNDIVEED